MFKLIISLHEVLNMIKGFSAGYTTANRESMLIEYEGKVYKISFEELGDKDIEEYIEELKY